MTEHTGNSAKFGCVEEGCVRVQPVMHLERALSAFGLRSEPLLASVGLSGALFADPENTLPFLTLGELLERCALATACPHFGLVLASLAAPLPLGVLGEILPHCADVGSALACLRENFHLHDRGGMPTMTIEGDTIALAYAILVGPLRGFDQIQDMSLVFGLNIMRALCGREWKPRAVVFSRRRPDDVRPYQKVFPCPTEFDAESTSLVLSKADLKRRVPGADPAQFERLASRLAAARDRHVMGFLDRTRRCVHSLIVHEQFSVDAVASGFAISRRQLNRKLAREGTSIREIAGEVRCRLALHMIDETNMTMGRISAALGYSGTSTFNHAFRRWQGVGPKQRRRAGAA